METKHDMKEILGEDFFKEEVRCDYLVSAEMKRIWAVLIDMYLAFAEVCDKYGLKYYVIWGSLLGAIRHNGFIPWDDDFDVAMPRDDYNRFLKLAEKDFNYPLFLQTPYTDPGYYVSWAKLRNSTTTAISKKTSHRRFNQGLYLDIFPLDDCDKESVVVEKNEIYKLVKKLGVAMRHGNPFLDERQLRDEITYWTDKPLQDFEEMERIASSHSTQEDYIVARTVKHKFENIEVVIPELYDEYLKIQYGDYMSYPPVELRGEAHSDITFNPDKPYTEYLI